MPTSPAARSRYAVTLAGTALAAVLAAGQRADAHPHVWVSVETTVLYENGSFTGVKQRWLFDEFYSVQATEGLDANRDGKFDRAELAGLAKVNMQGLKEFDYFTFPMLGGQPLKLADATDAYIEHIETAAPPGPQPAAVAAAPASGPAPATPGPTTAAPSGEQKDGGGFWARAWNSILGKPAVEETKPKVLALTFTLPFKQPVLAEAQGFEISTYDPAFFIWFEQAGDPPVRVSAGSPADCTIAIRSPERDPGDVQRLGEAFFNSSQGSAFGFSVAKAYTVRCKTS